MIKQIFSVIAMSGALLLISSLFNSCTKEEPIVIGAVTGTVTDIEGNEYHTITYGTQEWMVENLKTTKYNDGTSIPSVTEGADWASLTTPGYCFYYNDLAYKSTYGALYNWYTVNTGKLAPEGWHVPTDAEWTTFEKYLYANKYNFSNFATQLGGCRSFNGAFTYATGHGFWWTSTEYYPKLAWFRNANYLYKDVYQESFGFSVRCVKD